MARRNEIKKEKPKKIKLSIQGFAYTPTVNKSSKIQVDSELTTKKQALERMDFIADEAINKLPNIKNYSQDELKNTKTIFNLNGQIPLIIDCINAICTHRKDLIKNKEIEDIKYYEATLPIEEFYNLALGNHKEFKKDLLKEIKNPAYGKNSITNDNDKVVFVKGSRYLVYAPFMISGIEFDEPKNKQQAIGGKVTKQITIHFFSGIWRNLIESEGGSNFLYTPFALSARMRATINKYPELDITDHKAYRRLLFFLLKYDYHNSNEIIFDPIEMAYFCNNNLLRNYTPENKKFRHKESKQFIEKGLQLFKKMQNERYLEGLKINGENYFTELKNGKYKISLLEPINKRFKAVQKRLPFDK